jgi:hypothetical protein
VRDCDKKSIKNRVRPAATVKATTTVTAAAAAAAAAVVVVVVVGRASEEIVEVVVMGLNGGDGGSRGGGGGGCGCGGKDILYHGAPLWVWIDQRSHFHKSLRCREDEHEGEHGRSTHRT